MAANLATISGAQVSPYMLASPSPPTLQVMGPEEIDFLFTMGGGGPRSSRWSMIVQGFVPGGIGDVPAQQLLDQWLGDGAGSVMRALESDTTLGGIVEDVTVSRSSGYLVYVIEGRGPVLGADWVVDIVA